ncbi:MAG: hypothetical protein K6C05_07300 [Anaerovibrio sp.]|uniref:hypothetical protein n=1 Tax=Anaerovibrio sp. TaxID=1872532 RepID=UPI0025DD5437|nr:hypothetical protein [Anaerovibrio sp.]MCR5176644.1 hypothetical protein [Anaerovibrio sp.]
MRVEPEEKLKKDAALELADVQIMSNTIIAKINREPLTENDIDVCRCESYAMQIIHFVEVKASAAMEYRAILRGYMAKGDYLYRSLSVLMDCAESLMAWLIPKAEERVKIKQAAYEKNKKRGYYL